MKLETVAYLGVPAITQETQYLYKRIDKLLNDDEPESETGFESVVELIKHMLDNRIADAVLYSRLSSRCKSHAIEFEEQHPEIDFQDLGEEYLEHSKEELENFRALMFLAQNIGVACSFDFSLKETANLKFAHPMDFLNFTQYREMMSIAEFYSLYRILLNTDILDDLDDEEQVEIILLIKESLEIEIQHFEDFFDFSEIQNERFLELLSKVKDDLAEGF